MMTRTDIINALIDRNGYQSYLEIGTQNRVNNFNKINCVDKTCVDPDPNVKANFVCTSDEFFSGFQGNPWRKYDIIFIDGLHHSDQCTKDIWNAYRMLSWNGSIVVHDANPQSELAQRIPRETKVWNGDVWKSIVELRKHSVLCFYTVDTDHGCTVIHVGFNDTRDKIEEELTYENFDKNRDKWLNLISVDKFKEITR